VEEDALHSPREEDEEEEVVGPSPGLSYRRRRRGEAERKEKRGRSRLTGRNLLLLLLFWVIVFEFCLNSSESIGENSEAAYWIRIFVPISSQDRILVSVFLVFKKKNTVHPTIVSLYQCL
jgi:hypothetical protein